MANYVTSLDRACEILRECQDKTVTFSGQTPEVVVNNPVNNIYPLYSEAGTIMCFVTSYISKKQSSQYESYKAYSEAILVSVNFDYNEPDTTMTYIALVNSQSFEDFAQEVFNVAGLRQIGVPDDNNGISLLGRPESGGNGRYSSSHSTHSAGRHISSHRVGESDRLHRIRTGTGTESSPTFTRGQSTQEAPDLWEFFQYVTKKGVNYFFEQLRDQGFWDKSYVKATNFTNDDTLKTYEASLSIARDQCINGVLINGEAFVPTYEESLVYQELWNDLITHFGVSATEYNMFVGTKTGNFGTRLEVGVTLTLQCVRTESNPNSLYICKVDANTRIFLQVIKENPFEQLRDSFVVDTFQVYGLYKRSSLDETFSLSGNLKYTRTMNKKYNILTVSREVIHDYFSGCAISELAIKWVQQDPTVTPPSEPGDTVEKVYPKWEVKFQPQIQVSLDPDIDIDLKFDPVIELKPTVSVYIPESQPNHEESTDGTIINNEGDTIINNNEYIQNTVINNYIINQYITNPGGEVVTTPTPTNPGVADTIVPDIGEIETPDPPTIVASEGNFYNVYFPLISQVNAFNAWLWSPSILDTIIKYVSNPMGAILSFGMFYADYPAKSLEFVDGINLGNMTYKPTSGGSQFARATELATVVDCGSVTLNHTFNSALDYEPFLSVGAYLPFVGEVQWSAADVVNSIISVRYNIDIITGSALCIVSVNKLDASGVKTGFSVPLYMYECNCLVSIPLAQSDFSRLYSSIAGALVGGAMGAAGLSASEAVMAARTPGMSAGLAEAIDKQNSIGRASDTISSVGNILGNTQIPVVQQGHVGISAGALGPKKPILIIRRRNAYMAEGYQEYEGYPANDRYILGQLNGFTRVKDVHVQGVPATEQELVMIEAALKEGVIL